MIGTIRKHSQFLWVFIIAGTIIAFVVFFMPGENPMDYFSDTSNYGTRYGVSLEREDRLAAERDAFLTVLIEYEQFPDNVPADRMGILIRNRLAMNSLVKKEGIQVSDETMRAWTRLLFSDRRTGQPSPQKYDNIVNMVKSRYTELDIEEYVRNTAAAYHLRQLYTLSGKLVSTRAADLFIRYENAEAEAEFVFVSETNYLGQVKPSTNDIATYFTNNIQSFRIPERVVVNYVHFDPANTNYLAEAEKVMAANTNLQARIDSHYQERGTNNFRNAEGEVLSKEDAAKEIRAEFLEEESGKVAEEASRVFANEVFKFPDVKSENLFNVAKTMGYEVKESEAFTELDGPKEMEVPGEFARIAFGLSTEEPLASPIRGGEEGVFVITFNRRVASELPTLTNVWDEVAEEYKEFKTDEVLREAGRKLATEVEEGLAAGKHFSDIVKAAKLDPVVVPPFSRTTRSIPQIEEFGVSIEEFATAAFDLEPGNASGFRGAREGGYIVYLKKLSQVSEDRVASGLENYVEELRGSRLGIVNAAWMEHEDYLSGALAERQAAEQQRLQREAEEQAKIQAETTVDTSSSAN